MQTLEMQKPEIKNGKKKIPDDVIEQLKKSFDDLRHGRVKRVL